jgi:carbonic anhydrase/acetyltransferase-like protein (isoleucine patch superfamily)
VTLGADAVLGPDAVLRADGQVIRVGRDFHLGQHSTVHIAHDLRGTTIGDRVSVGAHAVIHACTVGDDCVIEDGACVLDAAVLGRGCVVARGSVVFPRSELPAGMWCEGLPAVALRPLGPSELQAVHERTRSAEPAATWAVNPGTEVVCDIRSGFVAATVSGRGGLRIDEGGSLWYGCVVDDAGPGVTLAAGSNVQDNSLLRSCRAPVTVGAGSTVGHNVRLLDSAVGSRVLVGMGSVLAAGTVIEDDAMLAAGSATMPGQVLESGWLWGGRPARPLSRLDERRRALIQRSALIYRGYAREFAASEVAAGLARRS